MVTFRGHWFPDSQLILQLLTLWATMVITMVAWAVAVAGMAMAAVCRPSYCSDTGAVDCIEKLLETLQDSSLYFLTPLSEFFY